MPVLENIQKEITFSSKLIALGSRFKTDSIYFYKSKYLYFIRYNRVENTNNPISAGARVGLIRKIGQ